jgi:predicted PolB exonuclease-like 3'-5' exonuclease
MYLVFDIETVLDLTVARRWLARPDLSPDDAAEALQSAHPKLIVPKLPFHRIVAIAGALVGEDGQLLRLTALGQPEDDEATLVRAFFQAAESRPHPTLVGWNSSGFDLPCLIYRAIRHGIAAPRFYQSRTARNRYSEEGHLDLMDWLSGYGATTRVALDEMAALVGVPGKLGVDGSQVATLWAEGRIDAIRTYCETDVLTTTLVFGHWARHRGWFDEDRLGRLHDSARAFVETRRADSHWRRFWEEWAALDADDA